jgi:hypothetical protein
MVLKIERFQPEGMNVRMSGGKPSYSHVVTVKAGRSLSEGAAEQQANHPTRQIRRQVSTLIRFSGPWSEKFGISATPHLDLSGQQIVYHPFYGLPAQAVQ